MVSKSAKPTSDELLAQFDDLGVETNPTTTTDESQSPSKPTKPATDNNNKDKPTTTTQSEQDILAELDHLASQRPVSTEPRTSSKSPRPGPVGTPPSTDQSSEERPAAARRSHESGRSSRAGQKPTNVQPPVSEEKMTSAATEKSAGKRSGDGGGWLGGIFATASAAMKQAESAMKEIQNNEEAQKWAQQVKGNVGALKEIGGEIRSKALPTFTSFLHTLAPPISSHERLQIHVSHDLSGYPSIDPLIYTVFSRVMSQVEGGDLMVVQRGQESAPKRELGLGGYQSSDAGWHDGPWWRTVTPGHPRNISAVRGMVEATKLARASAESYASEYFAPKGGIEEAAKQATEVLNETNPVRSSDIFLAVQAVSQATSTELFQAGPTTEKSIPPGVVDADIKDEEIAFAIYLHDPIHGIAFHTVSQAIPQKWVDWLDAPAPVARDPEADADADVPRTDVPESIAEIIENGGVDPREWVAEWVEDSLALATGVVAQRYVARRMGVGEGGIGKGKMRAETASSVDSGAGEAARAL